MCEGAAVNFTALGEQLLRNTAGLQRIVNVVGRFRVEFESHEMMKNEKCFLLSHVHEKQKWIYKLKVSVR